MLSYNDACFLNGSLAFYTSTNTFSNPIFDVSQFTDNNGNDCKQEEGAAAGRQKQTGGQLEKDVSLVGRCANICDNLLFSIKSKMFVMELNFKRRLRSIKKYSAKNLPWLFHQDRRAISGRQTQFYSPTSQFYDSQQLEFNQQQQQVPIHQDLLYNNEKFWRNIVPDCKKSLNVQQEKILSRLEQTVQAKRNNQSDYSDLNSSLNNLIQYSSTSSWSNPKNSTGRLISKQTGRTIECKVEVSIPGKQESVAIAKEFCFFSLSLSLIHSSCMKFACQFISSLSEPQLGTRSKHDAMCAKSSA